MAKQILVDMDGVLADVYAQFIQMEFEETGIRRSLESLHGKIETEAFPNCDKYVRTTDFFRNAPVMRDSVEGLKYLNEKYNVYVVSSATEYPKSLREKLDWLNEFFPFISWKQIILCGKKDPVKGDIMIDDHTKNLDVFEGEKILFTQPHNFYIDKHEYERVDNWKRIMEIL